MPSHLKADPKQPPLKKTKVSQKKQLRLLDPKSDLVFKKIFGQHPELVKSFLNGLIPLPEGRLIQKVTYLTPEQAPRIPSMKNTIVDVKCTDDKGHIFIVEMQIAWSASFFKRFLYGASKAYVQQLEKGQTYDTLCPVYGLAILNSVFEKDDPEWYHHYWLANKKLVDKSLEGLELIFLELPKFTAQTWVERKMGALWLRFLKEAPDLDEIPAEFQEAPELVHAFELAQESAYTRQELEAYDAYIDAIRVTGTIRADARNEGKEEGIAEGKTEIAKKLLASGMSLEAVCEVTGLSSEALKSFLKKKA